MKKLFIPNAKLLQPFGIQFNKVIYISEKTIYRKIGSPLEVYCPFEAEEIKIENKNFILKKEGLDLVIKDYRTLSDSITVNKGSYLGLFGKYSDLGFNCETEVVVDEEFIDKFKQNYEIKPYNKRYLMDLFDMFGISYLTGMKSLEKYCAENGIKEFNNCYIKKIDPTGKEIIYFNYLSLI